MRRANHLLLTGVLAIVGCREPQSPAVVTTVLDAPPGGEAFEPTLAIDPTDPNHIVAAAMRGIPPLRTSTGIWVWRSTDGGHTWAGGALAAPRFPGDTGAQVFGADVIAEFAAEGGALLASISGVGARMGTFVSRVPAAPDAATAAGVLENSRDSLTGRSVFYDKPWMTVDRLEGSPHRGSVYLSGGAIVMETMPARLGEPLKGPILTRVAVATSRDGGRTFSAPTLVSDSAFAAQLAVTAGGALEVTYARLVNMQGSANAVFHRRSTDGGTTFGPPATVTTVSGDTLLDLPVLAARPNGDLLACWSQGVRTNERSNQVRCATRPASGVWSRPHPVDRTLPGDAAEAWPAVVGTDRGWYLMEYVVGPSRTEVILYRSTDGDAFERVASLAAMPGLGADRFCVNSVASCRRSSGDGFVMGDYISLAASQGRLAGAYILPRPPDRAPIQRPCTSRSSRSRPLADDGDLTAGSLPRVWLPGAGDKHPYDSRHLDVRLCVWGDLRCHLFFGRITGEDLAVDDHELSAFGGIRKVEEAEGDESVIECEAFGAEEVLGGLGVRAGAIIHGEVVWAHPDVAHEGNAPDLHRLLFDARVVVDIAVVRIVVLELDPVEAADRMVGRCIDEEMLLRTGDRQDVNRLPACVLK